MKVIVTDKKPGYYCNSFIIEGYRVDGTPTLFVLGAFQADTYTDAIRFWNKHWGNRGCEAHLIRRADPIDTDILVA